MALSVQKTSSGREYKVKDLSQAGFGRLEIELAEVEMPGLMACRAEFGPSKPFAGVRISGSLHMTTQTAVLIETLAALGAEGRWCACNIVSTQDHAAAAVARDSAAVFAWKGETLDEYWWCIERCLDGGKAGGPDLIVDDGGDATLLIHEGVKAEEEYEKTGKIPDPESTDNAEFKIVLTIIRDGLDADPNKYRRMKERLVVFDGSANFAQQTLLATWRVVGIADKLREPNLATRYDASVALLADAHGTVYDNRGMGAELRRLLPFAGIGACSVAINGLAAGPGSPVVAFHLFALLLGGLFLFILHVLRA